MRAQSIPHRRPRRAVAHVLRGAAVSIGLFWAGGVMPGAAQSAPAPAITPAAVKPPNPATVTVAPHRDFVRLTLRARSGPAPVPSRDGDRVTIDLGQATLDHAPSIPFARDAAMADGRLVLTLSPGQRIRTARIGAALYIDVLAAPATANAPATKAGPAPVPTSATPAPAAPAPTPSAPAPLAAASPAVPSASTGNGDAGADAAAPIEADGANGFFIPLPARTGVAAFSRAGIVYVVLDQVLSLDPGAARALPGFADLALIRTPSGTVLRFSVGDGRVPRARRSGTGLTVHIADARDGEAGAAASPPAIVVRSDPDGVSLGPAEPGGVVTVTDAAGGGLLLAGTVRSPGAVPIRRQTPAFAVLPTFLGVAVEPLADAVSLRAEADHFTLAASGPAPAADAAGAGGLLLGRLFDLPDSDVPSLRTRLRDATDAVAAAPALARGKPRRAEAEALLALGMGAEASAVVALARADDPRLADDPAMAAIGAVAALLDHRPAEADGIDDSRLGTTDEITFWRAVRAAATLPPESGLDGTASVSGLAQPAVVFAALAALPLSYPDPLRRALLPLVAETMARGGQGRAAADLLATVGDAPSLASSLALARAMLAEAEGRLDDALAAYDALARGADRRARAWAARRAVELRLVSGALDAAKAADAIETLRAAWRGDGLELSLLLRLAELRGAAGQWRAGLSVLRDAAALFPEASTPPAAKRALLTRLFTAARGGEPPSADDLLAAAAETDALAALDVPAALDAAPTLLAFDLPARARDLLASALARAGDPPARALIGARLAEATLAAGDAAGAAAALSATEAPEMPDPARRDRARVASRVAEARGDTQAALDALAPLDAGALDEARASVLDRAGRVAEATAALARHVARVLPLAPPAAPPPTEAETAVARALLLRLATDASRAGDAAALAVAGARAAWFGDGPEGDALRLLALPARAPSAVTAAADATLARRVAARR